MSVGVLVVMAIAFVVLAGLLTAAEAAYGYLPRHEAEALLTGRAGKPLKRILQHPVAHMHALRFWRVWFEMATAVSVAMAFQLVVENLWLAGLLATVTMAGVGFVLVGVSPRQIGRRHVTGVVVLTAGLVSVLRTILGPIPGWLVKVGSAVAPGTQGPDAAFFTEEEFRELLDRASEADMIENTEAELIHSVFELGDTKVRSVMVPRTDMVCIDSGSTLRQAMSLFLRSGYSRVPVIEDSADQIVGILYLKDVAAQMHGRDPEAGSQAVDGFCRPVRYVPESKAVGELLQELQRESTHVAVVIDEYGGTAGLVTLEDLIEEIVGEIVDEYDSERPDIEDLGDGRYRLSSKAGIDDLGELFDISLEDDEVDTVGGLLAKALGRVPIVGSEVVVESIVLHAERLEGRRNRVSHVLAWRQPENGEDYTTAAAHPDRPQTTELVPRND
ncbi:hemolysin family protein [Arthrobacter koreensis]|uniref:Hemolysin family protein n=2 Tax=Arthrobacter koreensis TaxID=199136 RepID=A0ABY6FNN3_9MICC|nr:hemolysin family protein [Arthrobacter koreensis]MDF2498099.1 ion transporter [Arthrobacter koreensis]UYB34725.1 hemolysin family protein [Arthrobacter koreensis]